MTEELRFKLEEINDCIRGALWEFDEFLEKSEEKSKKIISNIDDFIYKLKEENLYTDDLGVFIERYLKYYNK